jgi:glycosyltransferase involved in cell wall biosynthesis
MTRVRVLLVAEAANPEWTSVPLVGWCHARALARRVDAHLVTQVRNRAAIERAGLRHGDEFTAIDSESVAGPLHRLMTAVTKLTGLGWSFDTAMQLLPYYYFEWKLWRRFGSQIEAGRWDVVHRLTPVSPTLPSILASRCRRAGVPFVWGPINGGVPWPDGFGTVKRREGEWLHHVRGAYKLLPAYRSTRRDSRAILAGSRTTLGQLAPAARHRAIYIPENGIDPEQFDRVRTGSVSLPLKVAFVGRLVPCKGVDLLLEATQELLRSGRMELDIIGDGPEQPALAAQIDRLGVGGRVRLDGWVEHRHIQDRLLESDVFALPSVREFGGGAVLEAMALGLVPVVADYGGPAELVTDSTGFRVPLDDRETLVVGLRKVFEQLVTDPSAVRPLGERARRRVLRYFTWSAKAEQTLAVYRWVIDGGPEPDFGMPFPD